ncbi:hypothetical protein EJ08DRAFT_694420 [Tothia fuscella]|uniref:Uncharacterized protein n=1 Tax=Tothia fuscella TaxID=1048955 RepID=A0A9P4NXM7_9PEZI|nr:hypothetical protein EJ08DRAFT_694420 [Tothia fuscella]
MAAFNFVDNSWESSGHDLDSCDATLDHKYGARGEDADVDETDRGKTHPHSHDAPHIGTGCWISQSRDSSSHGILHWIGKQRTKLSHDSGRGNTYRNAPKPQIHYAEPRRQRGRAEAKKKVEEEKAYIQAQQPHAAALRIQREDLAGLVAMRAVGSQRLQQDLKALTNIIAHREINHFLQSHRKSQELKSSPSHSDTESNSLEVANVPHSTSALVKQGFTKWQATIIQSKLRRPQDETKKVSHYPSDVLKPEELIMKRYLTAQVKDGWRPEHNAILNKLRKYNAWLTEKIASWEEEEKLLNYLEEILEKSIDSPDVIKLWHDLSPVNRGFAASFDEDEEAVIKVLEEWEDLRYEARLSLQCGGSAFKDIWPEERFKWEGSKYRRDKLNSVTGVVPPLSKAATAKQAKFDEWWAHSAAILLDKEDLLEFPAPPCGVCFMKCCKEQTRKGFNFCARSLKLWYQNSDSYKEAIALDCRRFHPDRFSKCGEDVKEKMVASATSYFQILRSLLEQEAKAA